MRKNRKRYLPEYQMKRRRICTDGICYDNPGGVGGYAAVIEADGEVFELSGFVPITTKNRIKLIAVIAALEALPKPSAVTVYTTSKYVVDGIQWAKNSWQPNSWRKSDGTPAKNSDLWNRLLTLYHKHNLRFRLIKEKSKVSSQYQLRCSYLARNAVQSMFQSYDNDLINLLVFDCENK